MRRAPAPPHARERRALPCRTPRGRIGLRLGALVALVALVASCSLQDEQPATVTLPEMDTTTTTTPTAPGGQDELAPEGSAEPLPVEWITQVGGPGDDVLSALTGRQDRVVAVGSSTGGLDDGSAGASAGGADVLVTIVDPTGEPEAVRTSGSTGDDRATGAATTGEGGAEGVTVCGSTAGDLGAASAGGVDLWCSLLDEDGVLAPARQLGGPDDEELTDVGAATGAETSYASGALSGLLPGAQDPAGRGLGNGDALVMQLGADAQAIWARQFGTPLRDAALAAAGSADGDGIAAGVTGGDLEGASAGADDGWVSRFDPQGNQRWITQVGSPGTDSLSAVAVAGDASRGTEMVVAAGVSDGDLDGDGPGTNAGLNDPVAVGVASDGTLEWVAQFGSESEETVGGVAVDGTTVYVTGSTSERLGDLVADGGPGGARDGFLAAVDALTGEVLWISRFGSERDEEMTGLTVTETGLLVASGVTNGRVGDVPNAGGDDGFLIAFSLAAAGGGAASSV